MGFEVMVCEGRHHKDSMACDTAFEFDMYSYITPKHVS